MILFAATKKIIMSEIKKVAKFAVNMNCPTGKVKVVIIAVILFQKKLWSKNYLNSLHNSNK